MKNVLFIQHGDVDKPGLVAEVLADLGIPLRVVHPYAGEVLPEDASQFDELILGGGGQSAYEVERFPYLESECALIRSALALQKPILGLCLGGQLIAKALGAEVRRAESKEIGFFRSPARWMQRVIPSRSCCLRFSALRIGMAMSLKSPAVVCVWPRRLSRRTRCFVTVGVATDSNSTWK
ncbi:MAG: type 1 glutamine amidotransferase [Spartobacteria bacterium]